MMRGLTPVWVRWAGCAIIVVLVLPLAGLLSRIEWGSFATLITSPTALTALGLSLVTSLGATVIAVALGIPVAIALARVNFPPLALRIIRTVVLLPLVLPPVVGGITLLATYGRRGLVGALLLPFGIEIGFTTLAVVLAQVFVAMPFFILTVEGALRSNGTDHEATALTLGATPTRALAEITLPLMLPSLVTGAVLTFARALGEFGATITFAGSLPGVTRTLPLEIYLQREVDPDAALALSLLLVVVALVIVAVAYHAPAGPGGRRRREDAAARSAGARAKDAGESSEAGALARTAEPTDVSPLVGTAEPSEAEVPAETAERDEDSVAPVAVLEAAPHARGAGAPLEVRIRLADRDLDVAFTAAPGETIALVGPNGAGKSSCLDAIAGLIAIDEGLIRLADRVLDEPARRAFVPANTRQIARLGQRSALFPHLTLAQNVAFGPRAHAMPRAEARELARSWLERVGLARLGSRRPHEVSGGQEQRAAIARALAVSPQLFLWDEPFAALDVTVAPVHRELLRTARGARTALLVTHDLDDVRALADRVVVLEGGRVAQCASLDEFLAHPAPGFAAEFVRGAAVPASPERTADA